MNHKDDTLREEGSAFGQRVKGAVKDAAGAATGNRTLEREGEIENAEGRDRQARNDVFDETDGVPAATVGGFPTSAVVAPRSDMSARLTAPSTSLDSGDCPKVEVKATRASAPGSETSATAADGAAAYPTRLAAPTALPSATTAAVARTRIIRLRRGNPARNPPGV